MKLDRLFKIHDASRTPVYIIAEIGGNFTTFAEARRLVDAAVACGVDAVKLQTYRADTLASRKAVFDMENTGVVSQYNLFRKYEIDEELHRAVFAYAGEKGLDWFSTPSHETDVEMLERLGCGAFKVGSDDAVNLPFLRFLARTGKPLLLSTGMCTMEEVRESVSVILGEGNSRLILLHAITSYPTYPEDVNLLAMRSMAEEFRLPVGYSDHTLGSAACIASAAMGAALIEKHFTVDKDAEGPDHMLSADPVEMKFIVDQIRLMETMLGSGIKMPAASERVTRINNRKSLVTTRDLPEGHRIGAGDVAVKRPGSGIPPKFLSQVLGRALAGALAEGDVLSWEDLA